MLRKDSKGWASPKLDPVYVEILGGFLPGPLVPAPSGPIVL